MGRYGKNTTGAGIGPGVVAGRGGYSPPSYSLDHYSYSDKGREEGNLEIMIIFKIVMELFLFKDSYLARMNHMKKGTQYKRYNGRDYQQFKKNYEFGAGSLGFDFDNPTYKEKVHDFFFLKLNLMHTFFFFI